MIENSWAYIGALYLIMLTYQDYRHNMEVDDRKNYYMYGLTSALFFISQRPIWYGLVILIIAIGTMFFLAKTKFLGEADTSSLGWIMYGFALINPLNLIWFFGCMTFFTAVLMAAKRVMKITEQTPYYGVLLGSFVIACYLANLIL